MELSCLPFHECASDEQSASDGITQPYRVGRPPQRTRSMQMLQLNSSPKSILHASPSYQQITSAFRSANSSYFSLIESFLTRL